MRKLIALIPVVLIIAFSSISCSAGVSPALTTTQSSSSATLLPPPVTSQNYDVSRKPKPLTDSEKQELIDIALNTPEAKAELAKNSSYTTEIGWRAILWDGSQVGEWWSLDYNIINTGVPVFVKPEAVIYPGVLIRFNGETKWLVDVTIDLASGKVEYVQGYPARTMPSITTSTSPAASVPPPAATTITVDQTQTDQGITLVLDNIVITDTELTFNVIYTPPGYTPGSGMPSNIPGGNAEYSVDGGPVKDLMVGPFSITDKGIKDSWFSPEPLPQGAGELTFQITNFGGQSGVWKFQAKLK